MPVKHISFKFFSSETSEALAMRAGEIDVAFPNDGATFASASGAKVTSWLNNQIGYFSMNTKLAPWSDIHVRRAVAYALNRADIIAAGGGATSAVPLYDFFPAIDLDLLGSKAQVSAIIGALPKYSFDLAAARAQLAESAYPHGFTASMDVCQTGDFINMDQVIAAELQRIGITLKLKTVTCDAWVTELYGPKNFGPMFSTSHSSIVDPSGLSAYMLGSQAVPAGGLNVADYTPPRWTACSAPASRPATRRSGWPSTSRSSRTWRPTSRTCRSSRTTPSSPPRASSRCPRSAWTPSSSPGRSTSSRPDQRGRNCQ